MSYINSVQDLQVDFNFLFQLTRPLKPIARNMTQLMMFSQNLTLMSDLDLKPWRHENLVLPPTGFISIKMLFYSDMSCSLAMGRETQQWVPFPYFILLYF